MVFLCTHPSAQFAIVGQQANKVLVVFSGLRRRTFGPLTNEDQCVLDALSTGEPIPDVTRVGNWLIEEGFAEVVGQRVKGLPPDWPTEWSRQMSAYATFAGIDGARRLHDLVRNSRIMVIGLGGIGSHVVQHLVRIGVSTFTLIDPDQVDTSNLNRQVLYERADVGLPKVQVAEAYIRRLCDSPTVHSMRDDFLECSITQEQVRLVDLAIVSADSAPAAIQRRTARLFFPLGIKYAFASYSGDHGKIGPIVFDHSNGCGCCHQLRIPVEDALIRVEGSGLPRIPASSYAMNAMLAATLVDKWLRHMAGCAIGPETVRFSLASGMFQSSRYERLQSCPVCGSGYE